MNRRYESNLEWVFRKSGLWLPKPLRMSPGYPCCCNQREYVTCTDACENNTNSKCWNVTISGLAVTTADGDSLNGSYDVQMSLCTAYRIINCETGPGPPCVRVNFSINYYTNKMTVVLLSSVGSTYATFTKTISSWPIDCKSTSASYTLTGPGSSTAVVSPIAGTCPAIGNWDYGGVCPGCRPNSVIVTISGCTLDGGALNGEYELIRSDTVFAGNNGAATTPWNGWWDNGDDVYLCRGIDGNIYFAIGIGVDEVLRSTNSIYCDYTYWPWPSGSCMSWNFTKYVWGCTSGYPGCTAQANVVSGSECS